MVNGYNVMLGTVYKLHFNCNWKVDLQLPFSSSECHILNLDQDCMHKLMQDGRSNSDACKANVLASN